LQFLGRSAAEQREEQQSGETLHTWKLAQPPAASQQSIRHAAGSRYGST